MTDGKRRIRGTADLDGFFSDCAFGMEENMGKPTGFMEYARQTSEAIAPKERIKNFIEKVHREVALNGIDKTFKKENMKKWYKQYVEDKL